MGYSHDAWEIKDSHDFFNNFIQSLIRHVDP